MVWEAAGHLGRNAGEITEGHVAGAAVHAGADRRQPRALLGQRIAEGAVSDEAVPPACVRGIKMSKNISCLIGLIACHIIIVTLKSHIIIV